MCVLGSGTFVLSLGLMRAGLCLQLTFRFAQSLTTSIFMDSVMALALGCHGDAKEYNYVRSPDFALGKKPV